MSASTRNLIIWLVMALVASGAAWLWFANMEQRWEAQPRRDVLGTEPMRAAQRLMQAHGYQVMEDRSLGKTLAAPLPDGTLILLQNGSALTELQLDQLLRWVNRGNTLVVQPPVAGMVRIAECKPMSAKAGDKAEGKAAASDEDEDDDAPAAQSKRPLAQRFGVISGYVSYPLEKPGDRDKRAACTYRLRLPGSDHDLRLEPSNRLLHDDGPAKPAQVADTQGVALRIHAHGKGRVVFVAESYFINQSLENQDHAELLLALLKLAPAQHVRVVRSLDALPWYQLLWNNFAALIIGLACLLALLLWRVVRRFGPVLPSAQPARRALLEHIDASARWLWRVPGGRDILLAAARMRTQSCLERWAAHLQRMAPTEQLAALAAASGLPLADIDAALNHTAAKLPLAFTRQIRTLAQLRLLHER
jgi:hypothetical protein